MGPALPERWYNPQSSLETRCSSIRCATGSPIGPQAFNRNPEICPPKAGTPPAENLKPEACNFFDPEPVRMIPATGGQARGQVE
jgi:hypothetical protein